MKILSIFLLALSLTTVAKAQQHPFDPLPPSCVGGFNLTTTPPGFTGYCCNSTAQFVVAPQMTCVSGYIPSPLKPKPIKKQTYSYCCKMNNPNGGGHGGPKHNKK